MLAMLFDKYEFQSTPASRDAGDHRLPGLSRLARRFNPLPRRVTRETTSRSPRAAWCAWVSIHSRVA